MIILTRQICTDSVTRDNRARGLDTPAWLSPRPRRRRAFVEGQVVRGKTLIVAQYIRRYAGRRFG